MSREEAPLSLDHVRLDQKDERRVRFVVALPKDRRVVQQQVPIATWSSWASSKPREDAFFEMGVYGGEQEVVLVIPLRSSPDGEVEEDDELDEPISEWAPAPLSAP